jgi:lipoyl synthase
MSAAPYNYMKKLRLSLGSAAILDLTKAATKTRTKTIFLMNSGGCIFNCSFCAQASQATSGADKLSRVSWPEFDADQVLVALENQEGVYERICMQVVNTPGIFTELPELVSQIRKKAGDKKIALSVRTSQKADIDALFSAGANEVGLSIDAIDPEQFVKIKGGSLASHKEFVLNVADNYPGKIATHLIVGMGESEAQAVQIIQELHSHQVIIALFAFTPVKGSQFESKKPPDINSYRRIQIALHLVRNNEATSFTFDKKGRIIDFGYDREELFEVLRDSNVFETSGCSDCNRPYYNERSGSKELYNHPYKIRDEVVLKEKIQGVFVS